MEKIRIVYKKGKVILLVLVDRRKIGKMQKFS